MALPRELRSARAVRSWIAEEIAELSSDRRDEVALLVSELVTNVVQHTDSGPVVTLRAEKARLVVGVADSSPAPAAVREPDPARPGGWGLQLVERIADSWGTQHLGDGAEVVWFAIDLGT